ncbi:hypothetical protein P9112_008783 [Eukaryota sp. TZLM1-RC]
MCLLLLEVHSRFRYAHQRPYCGSSTRREKQHLCLHGASPKNNNETFNPKNYLPERLNFAERLYDISKFQDFVLKITSYDSDKALDLLRQFSVFQRFHHHTSFGRPLALAGREKENFNAMIWWQQFCYDALELQKLALQVVSQFVSASAVERLWSLHDWIHSKRRNRLTEERVNKLIAVYDFLASCRQEEDSEEDNKTEDCIEILNVCCQLLEEED